eukprot:TRINITY_DN87168_c0_g1_i1.p1 TRINITY_DN87168_c0_g1~~TRINITY_DN87168_c0_g1_i1.p1  ORF type:complete len:515 (-),score=92.50 TRINITY_DN87168_c0_g1_i1:22-1509(-)
MAAAGDPNFGRPQNRQGERAALLRAAGLPVAKVSMAMQKMPAPGEIREMVQGRQHLTSEEKTRVTALARSFVGMPVPWSLIPQPTSSAAQSTASEPRVLEPGARCPDSPLEDVGDPWFGELQPLVEVTASMAEIDDGTKEAIRAKAKLITENVRRRSAAQGAASRLSAEDRDKVKRNKPEEIRIGSGGYVACVTAEGDVRFPALDPASFMADVGQLPDKVASLIKPEESEFGKRHFEFSKKYKDDVKRGISKILQTQALELENLDQGRKDLKALKILENDAWMTDEFETNAHKDFYKKDMDGISSADMYTFLPAICRGLIDRYTAESQNVRSKKSRDAYTELCQALHMLAGCRVTSVMFNPPGWLAAFWEAILDILQKGLVEPLLHLIRGVAKVLMGLAAFLLMACGHILLVINSSPEAAAFLTAAGGATAFLTFGLSGALPGLIFVAGIGALAAGVAGLVGQVISCFRDRLPGIWLARRVHEGGQWMWHFAVNL